jgi:hypothetical protein
MPVHTVDKLRQRESSLKKRLAAQGAGGERSRRQALKKALRRTQRKRRRVLAETARRAKTVKAGAGAGPDAAAAGSPGA